MQGEAGNLIKVSRKASWNGLLWQGGWWLALIWMIASAEAQTCQSATDMDAAVRSTLETTGRRYFDMAARGDSAALKQNAIPALASNFSGIEAAVKDNQPAFAAGHVTVRPPFLLAAGNPPQARAEFLCGVFGSSGQTKDSAVFILNNLPPGKYGVAIVDAKGNPDTRTLTMILQQLGSDWKLAGFYARSSQINGHDASWFAQRARDFKAKGQNRNAWLYFREAITLTTPAEFMSTLATDKLYDEAQSVQPTDLPVNGNIVDLSAAGTTYKLIAIFPLSVGGDLDLLVRYQAADISNTLQTFQTNNALIKALVAKFPEFRDAFAGVVARAVDPSGQDYGSMLPMKQIK
jgi:hypothetical protein